MDAMTEVLLNATVPLPELREPEIPYDPRKGKDKVGDHPKKKSTYQWVVKLVFGGNDRPWLEKDLRSVLSTQPFQREKEGDLRDTIIWTRAQRREELERSQPKESIGNLTLQIQFD